MTILLPVSRYEYLVGLAIILGAAMLPLFMPSAPLWRLGSSIGVIAIGAVLWSVYWRRRPRSLTIRPKGGLACGLRDDRRVEVEQVLCGYIDPRCLSVRLTTSDGHRRALLLFADALTADAHRQVRHAMIGFRPPRQDGLKDDMGRAV